jgi:ATP-binding protein involved in chromosome partitioning
VSAAPLPRRIHRGERDIVITWDDRHVASWPARPLRLECPCAACKEEMTGRPLLDPATVPQDVAAAAIALVGSYAIRVTWTDGHDSGIYTYDWLRSHCPCEACAGPEPEHGRAPSPNG